MTWNARGRTGGFLFRGSGIQSDGGVVSLAGSPEDMFQRFCCGCSAGKTGKRLPWQRMTIFSGRVNPSPTRSFQSVLFCYVVVVVAVDITVGRTWNDFDEGNDTETEKPTLVCREGGPGDAARELPGKHHVAPDPTIQANRFKHVMPNPTELDNT